MRSYRWFFVLCLSFLLFGCSGGGGTYSLYLRYDPVRDFPAVQEKLGSTLAIGPFKDERPETLYIGTYIPNQGAPSYFQSEPFPLEKAIQDSVSQALSQRGVKTVLLSNWDNKPEALPNLDADSILTMEIKTFWTEAKASLIKTDIITRMTLVVHLGVKKEGKVFTRQMKFDREKTLPAWEWDRDQMAQTINQVLREIFDPFFSNPY